jgi:hypothetical protein
MKGTPKQGQGNVATNTDWRGTTCRQVRQWSRPSNIHATQKEIMTFGTKDAYGAKLP